jgi:hypothetical protein
MNMLHTLVATLVENFSTVSQAFYACFHLGIALSVATVLAGLASLIYPLFRRSFRI